MEKGKTFVITCRGPLWYSNVTLLNTPRIGELILVQLTEGLTTCKIISITHYPTELGRLMSGELVIKPHTHHD